MDPSKVPNPPTPQQAEDFHLSEEEYWQRFCNMVRDFILFYHSPGRTVAVTWPPPGIPEGDNPGQAGVVNFYVVCLKTEYERMGWEVTISHKEHTISFKAKGETNVCSSGGKAEAKD